MDTSKRPAERQKVGGFPQLGSYFEVLGAVTDGGMNGVYNCLAWTSGNVRQWEWKPQMNRGGVGSIQSMDRLYASTSTQGPSTVRSAHGMRCEAISSGSRASVGLESGVRRRCLKQAAQVSTTTTSGAVPIV